MPTNRNKPSKTRKETARGPRENKSHSIHYKIKEKRKQARKLRARSKKHLTITENLSRAKTQVKRILTNPEKFLFTELGEIDSRKFKHTELSETKKTNNDF